MAIKIGADNILSSYAQSAGWKLLNQLVNTDSKFGFFDKNGNPFYETGLKKNEIKILNKTLSFSMGNNVAEAGVIYLKYKKEYKTSTAPVEGGKVVAYNLVEQPRTGQVTYVSTGTQKQRILFEDALEHAENSTNVYILHTAERLINNVKITAHSVERNSSKGFQLVRYLIDFQEIISTPKNITIKNARSYSNDSVSQGTTQPHALNGNQKQAANKSQKPY